MLRICEDMKTHRVKIFKKAAGILKIIAHPARIEIIDVLARRGTVSVGELEKTLGISQSMTSQHLAALRHAGVIEFEKEGNRCLYRLRNKNVLKLLKCIEESCSG